MRGPAPAWLLVLAAAVLWGTTGTARALGPPAASPVSVGAVRILLGAAALLLLARCRGGLRRGAGLPAGLVLLGGAAVAAYQPAFFAAVSRTGVAVGTMIAIGSAPVAAGLLAWAARGERPGRAWLTATALAIPGGALLATAGAPILLDPPGILFALAAGASYAVYATVSKQLLQPHRDPLAVMAILFGTGAAVLLPLLAADPPTWLATPRGTLMAAHLGLLATALSYTLFGAGLARVRVATAATISLAEPLTATLLGVAVLRERLTAAGVLGAGLVMVGLAVLARGESRARSVAK